MLAHAPALRSFAGEAAVTDAEQLGMSQAFTQAFATVDAEILDAARQQPNSDGATCVALLRVGTLPPPAHLTRPGFMCMPLFTANPVTLSIWVSCH